jgi:hypothetical protein
MSSLGAPGIAEGARRETQVIDSTDSANSSSLNRLAFNATTHCLFGCAIGEVLGMVLATLFGWGTATTVVLATLLAFTFGYLMTILPLLQEGMEIRRALTLAFASDTVSITIMEIVDNLVVVLIPGAMNAGLTTLLFWGSLFISLIVAGIAAFPVNRWLVSRGRGHALVHQRHVHGDALEHTK